MTDELAEDSVLPKGNPQLLDNILSVTIGTLITAILLVGGYFGYSVWSAREAARDANPAYRLIDSIKDEIRQYPNEAALRVRLGELLTGVSDYAGAIDQFNNALKIDPEHLGAYIDLGYVGMITEDYDAARGNFLKVIELSAGSDMAHISTRRDEAYFNLGRIELDDGEYEEAIGYLKEALRIRRDASDTYYYLARAYRGLGEPDAAIEQLEIALAFDPNFAQAQFLMGQLYMDLDDLVNASARFYTAAALAPEADPPAEALASLGTSEEWEARARTALEAGDIDEAVKSVLVSRNLDPSRPAPILLHAEIAVDRGDADVAIDVYRAVLVVDPENESALEALERLGAPEVVE